MYFGLTLVLAICNVLLAQDGPILPRSAPAQPPPGLTLEQQEELDRIIHVIRSERNDPETRRFGAERLLKSDLPTRIDAAAKLLTTTTSAGAPAVVCEAIARLGRRNPEQLDERLVDPLLALLGNENAQLSSAAASALSVFRSSGVARRLGVIAADEQRPAGQRVAAIDALALNTKDRSAVKELISLSTTANPWMVERVLEALRPASGIDYGADVEAWSAWWQRQSALSEERWLRDRLDLAVERYEALRDDHLRAQREAQSRDQLIAQRFNELLRSIYQITPQQSQKEAKLQQWLADPVVEYRLCALGLLREQITEGNTPAPAIREAVKRLFSDASPAVRIEALEMIGILKDPEDATAVLALLPNQNHPAVRETFLRVLGRLENPTAIEALIAELKDPTAHPGCMREAAHSLGTLGAQGRVDASVIAPAIQPLKDRFGAAPEDDLRLKEALLGAMALIGDAALTPEFVANLSAEAPELLLAAIRGIKTVGANDQIDRLLTHLTHVDPRVRQLAAEAVGTLGTEVHLEALFNRLTPNVEANEGVRNAAWDGLRAVLFRSAAPVRMQWANRLDHLPDRQIQLFNQMIDTWIADGSAPPELVDARQRLVDTYLAHGNYAEAVPVLQQLRAHFLEGDIQQASQLGVQLIRTVLQDGGHNRVNEIIIEVAKTADDPTKGKIVNTIFDHLHGQLLGGPNARLAALVKRLQSLPGDLLGPQWQTRLDAFAAKLSQLQDDESGAATDPDSP